MKYLSLRVGLLGLATAALPLSATLSHADGIPATPLRYSGTFYVNDAAYDGPATFRLTIYVGTTSQTACAAVTANAAYVRNGKFSVELSPACAAAVSVNNELEIAVRVTPGSMPAFDMPRESIKASPYAVEAARAQASVRADEALPNGDIDQRLRALEERVRLTYALPTNWITSPQGSFAPVPLTDQKVLIGPPSIVDLTSGRFAFVVPRTAPYRLSYSCYLGAGTTFTSCVIMSGSASARVRPIWHMGRPIPAQRIPARWLVSL